MQRVMRAAYLGLPVLLLMAGCGKQTMSYTNHIKPIIDKHCVECHLEGGQGQVASGFLVASYDSLMKGTKFGPVIMPGDPLSSSLYRLIAGEVDPSIQMPHNKEPISMREIKTIELWIEQGAQNN